MAKADDQNALDGEGRKLGERTGLDSDGAKTLSAEDPGSPSCKRCRLCVGAATSCPGAAGKPLSLPPGEYGRKAEFGSSWRNSRKLPTAYLKELAGEHHKA